MNSRERVLLALNHQEPDRVPIDLGTSDTTMAAEVAVGVAQLLGLDAPQAMAAAHPAAYVTPDACILVALGADVRLVPVSAKQQPSLAPAVREVQLADGGMEWVHPDGTVFRRPAATWDVQLLTPAIRGELSAAEIDRIFPAGASTEEWADAEGARAAVHEWQAQGLAVQCNCIIMPVTGTSGGPLSLEQWMLEFASQPDQLCRLMDRYLEQAFAWAESFYTAVGPVMDMVYGLGDDVASQLALWMSPNDYRRYIKPRHAEIIRFIKARTDAKIIHHCCGACREIIPDLIEVGVEVLNPTQTSAAGMEPFALKRDFGNDIVFWGGIDVIELLPFGTVTEVEDAVKTHIDALAPGGGYIFAPSHMIPRGTPPQNVLAMYRTALTYGKCC